MRKIFRINIPGLLLIMLFPYSILNAEFVYQNNWSHGPGVSGPTSYWFSSFYSASQISWTTFPVSKLLLGMTKTAHVINGNFPGCHYAFPADMDGDGDMDVLAQSTDNCDVAWFKNDGSGDGWDIHTISNNYPIQRCAYPADLDNDGDMDVAGANSSISNKCVEWWRNDDGVGDSWTRFYIDDDYGKPLFVCCADINGNDTLEVISPSEISPHQIAWWESTTTPPDSTWEKHVISSGGVNRGWELFPVDLDQDGDMDILSAKWDDNGLNFWENVDGAGLSWAKHSVGDYWAYGVSVHAADIDSDNDMDVVYCNSEGREVSWWENVDGSCTNWEEHVLEMGDTHPRGVHAADVTDDGFVDIITAMDHELFIYRNMDGTGMEWAVYLLSSGWKFSDVDVADFNADGFTDILAAATSGAEVSWHEISGYSSGWLESSILGLGGYPQWDSIAWTGDEPPGTDLFFQVKSSNDWENMGAWSDTIFEPGSLVGYIDSTYRYIQYKVGMTSDSRFGTPVLDEVRFYWSNLGIEGEEGAVEFTITAVPNPSHGGVSIVVPPLYAEDAELYVYDLSGKVVRVLSGRNGNTFIWDGRDSSGHEAPTGTYIIRGIVEDKAAAVRFVKL